MFTCLAVELCLVFVVAICTIASKSSNVLILVFSPGLEASLCIIFFCSFIFYYFFSVLLKKLFIF